MLTRWANPSWDGPSALQARSYRILQRLLQGRELSSHRLISSVPCQQRMARDGDPAALELIIIVRTASGALLQMLGELCAPPGGVVGRRGEESSTAALLENSRLHCGFALGEVLPQYRHVSRLMKRHRAVTSTRP